MYTHMDFAFLYVILNLLFEKKIHNWPHGFMSSVTDENNFHKFDDLFQGPIISTIFLLYFQFSVNWVLKSHSLAEKPSIQFYR